MVLRAARVVFRVIGWLATLAAVLVLLAVIVLFLGARLSGWNLRVILSGSMEPALPVGSLVFVEPRAPEEVQVGDILTFRPSSDPNQQVTHRVVEIRGEGSALQFETKGDANEALDRYPVPAGDVVGTVRWHVPQLGYLVERVATGEGFLLFVLVPGAFIISGELWNIMKAVRRERRNRAQVRRQEAPVSSPQPAGDVLSAVSWRAPRPGHPVKRAATGQRLILLVLILLVVTVGAFIIGGELWSIAGPVRRGRRSRARVRRQEGRG